MEKTPHVNYLELMKVIKSRIDSVEVLSKSNMDAYSKSEMAAFHGRKIIEAIAFGCLNAIKNGLKSIPKEAIGQYNAEKIFKQLKRKGIEVSPSPSLMRVATDKERAELNVTATIDGLPERRITNEELIKKYQRMHNWLHELNPYTKDEQEVFYSKNQG